MQGQFLRQHSPDTMPVAYELNQKWKAWIACGALASEMESAAPVYCGSRPQSAGGRCDAGLANQTRRELGLEDVQVHDTESAVKVAVEAVRSLILRDQKKAE